jgi:hypothetical protein
MSYLVANSDKVCSPLIASSATLALNSAEYLLRFVLLIGIRKKRERRFAQAQKAIEEIRLWMDKILASPL